jgi:hypothetical protein
VIFDVSGVPVTRRRVRKVRIWMTLLLLTPVCLALISLLAFGTSGPPEPVIHPRSTPHGYQAITDADFGYAIPSGYQQNTTWTDQNADFLYGSSGAFVAETLASPDHPPTASSPPPLSFSSFGEPRLVPFTAHGMHAVTVPGTRQAWEEQITRPGGWIATAVDAWEADTSTQIWLLVHAPAGIARTVVASLQG